VPPKSLPREGHSGGAAGSTLLTNFLCEYLRAGERARKARRKRVSKLQLSLREPQAAGISRPYVQDVAHEVG
jgi:hypothetical protein